MRAQNAKADSSEQPCALQCQHSQSTHVFMALGLDIIVMVAVNNFLLPALSPSPPIHSHLSTPSGTESRRTTATYCSRSILPLPWPGHLKWELLLLLSPNSPPCPPSQAHLKQENLITKACGAELSTQSVAQTQEPEFYYSCKASRTL